MIQGMYTEPEVAKILHRDRRWLAKWLLKNPIDPATGKLVFCQAGNSRRFKDHDIVRIIDLILTQEETIKPPEEGCVYFVEGGDLIKIGYSRCFAERIRKMQTDMPGDFRILLTVPGTMRTERELQRRFVRHRFRGEWFRKGHDLLEFIQSGGVS